MTNRALFLDRDGVINELVHYPSHDEWESPRHVDDLRLRPRVAAALKRATDKGWLVFLITNQPSYAKGKCSLEDLQQVHERVLELLKAAGVSITGSYVCYHHPQSLVDGFGACRCRKPNPYFLHQAAREHEIDLSRSWMAGDQDSDIETGKRAGCRTALIEYEHSLAKRGAATPDLLCASLAELIRKLD